MLFLFHLGLLPVLWLCLRHRLLRYHRLRRLAETTRAVSVGRLQRDDLAAAHRHAADRARGVGRGPDRAGGFAGGQQLGDTLHAEGVPAARLDRLQEGRRSEHVSAYSRSQGFPPQGVAAVYKPRGHLAEPVHADDAAAARKRLAARRLVAVVIAAGCTACRGPGRRARVPPPALREHPERPAGRQRVAGPAEKPAW